MNILETIKKNIKGKNIKIVFADTYEVSILRAAEQLVKEKLCVPFFVGDRKVMEKIAKENKINVQGFEVRDPSFDVFTEQFAKEYFEIRKAKGITMDEAKQTMLKSSFFAAMLLKHDVVQGMVSGYASPTKPFIPAFHIIGTKGARASSYFLMLKNEQIFLFSDCGLIIDPSSDELAEIALTTASTAKLWNIEPKVAMLSFSTRGSAKHALVDKVKIATDIAKKKNPSLLIDGEIQFDAAILPEVAKKKCPDSVLKGNANILIFPDLNAGNIAYKMAERLGGFTALGPLLQGLQKPVNDMSRGASVSDIVSIACITAYAAFEGKK
jgi:phosphate acetyltransferase